MLRVLHILSEIGDHNLIKCQNIQNLRPAPLSWRIRAQMAFLASPLINPAHRPLLYLYLSFGLFCDSFGLYENLKLHV